MTLENGSGGKRPVVADLKPRSSFRDWALILFYATIVLIAMGGWLWFLGWLSWNVIDWATGEMG
jgi:hypothetical protein